MFPFTDGPETDPETGQTDGLLTRAEARHVAPKIFHVLSNSEYFNRAGSLIHTDPAGQRDIEPPANARIYLIASGPHYSGPFPPVPVDGMAAPHNPLKRSPILRALLQALDAWVAEGTLPPPSRYPHISDGTLTAPEAAGWPKIPASSDSSRRTLASPSLAWCRQLTRTAIIVLESGYPQSRSRSPHMRAGTIVRPAPAHPISSQGRRDPFIRLRGRAPSGLQAIPGPP
jgi:hypothetical protein